MADASDQRPAPAAVGTLGSRPLVHLLVYARNRRLTGKLELEAADGRKGTIDLWRGRVSGARTTPPVAFFGTVAYELGCIDTTMLDATLLEISKTKRLHGEVLLARGAITPSQRDEILAEQACRKIHHISSFPPEATFSFYDARPSAEEPALTLDPIKPAWRGLRDNAPDDSLREVLERYATVPLRLANESPLTGACFNPEETALCEALTFRPMTIGQMRANSTLPAKRVELLAYLLVITKCAEPAPASDPSLPAARASNVPDAPLSQPRISNVPEAPLSQPRISVGPSSPASMPAMARTTLTPHPPESNTMRTAPPSMSQMPSGEVRISHSFRVPSSPVPAVPSAPPSSRRSLASLMPVFSPEDLGAAGIAHRAQSIESEDFFEMLGVPEGAPIDAARAAYFRLAKVWHPERLPDDLEPFRSEVEKIFMFMTRASATLTDPDSRRAYIETHDQNAAATTIASKPHADVVRDIEQSINKRDFAIAEQIARHLIDLDADDAEAQALAAWAVTQAGEATEEVLRAALPRLDKAVQKDTYCERAYFYRGVVHKRLGSSTAAFKDFNRVMQLNPKHVDAQREIRIFEMRARKGSGEHALEALISKSKKK
jgi:DnaJ domain